MNIKDLEVTQNTVIEDEKVLLSYEGIPLLSSNNLSIIRGEKGSMKSTFRDYLIRQMVNPEDGFESSFDGNVLVVDTEMSKRLIQNNLKRFDGFTDRV